MEGARACLEVSSENFQAHGSVQQEKKAHIRDRRENKCSSAFIEADVYLLEYVNAGGGDMEEAFDSFAKFLRSSKKTILLTTITVAITLVISSDIVSTSEYS